ncbi:MAG: tRNA-dihydrouridine synthase [Pseudomonadales bacterium]
MQSLAEGIEPERKSRHPPLNYERVYRLKKGIPNLEILINGGIRNLSQIRQHLQFVDGAIMGRQAYHNRWMPCRHPTPYIESQLDEGEKLGSGSGRRHILGFFQDIPGTRQFKQCLIIDQGADLDTLVNASHYLQSNQSYGGITFS